MMSAPSASDANRYVGFAQNQVTILTDADFTIGERVQIFLKEDLKSRCAIILFHGNNEESQMLSLVYSAVAAEVVGRDFYAVNLSYNKRIAKAMTSLMGGNSPLRWMSLKQLPFIAVYQNGEPVGIYNGSRTVQTLSNFVMTRACSSSYRERIQVFNSTNVDIDFGIPGIGESQIPGTSLEFTEAVRLRPPSQTAQVPTQPGTSATL